MTVVLGTRGSDLARAQTQLVEQALRARWPELEIQLRIVRTSGDEGRPADRRSGRKGLFTAEIEQQLIAGEIDLAIHSAKDLPSESGTGAVIAGVLPRASVGDVLISKGPMRRVGTSSVRRQHQLRAKWPGVEVVDLRGNVPTRLRKLAESDELDAIVLARAGLERLQLALNFPSEDLPLRDFVPAGGQGIIALQTRVNDDATRRLVEAIDHSPTHTSLRIEREFLRQLQGDCDSPVGVHADATTVRAQVFDSTGRMFAAEIDRGKQTPEEIGAMLFQAINEQQN